MSEIAEIIAGQLHNTKPDHLRPGADVGMLPLPSGMALGIYIGPMSRIAVVSYDEGRDEYNVAVGEAPSPVTMSSVERGLIRLQSIACDTEDVEGVQTYRGVHADQIGEFVWGDDAKDFTLPMVMFSDDDGETWKTIA